jgi:hypothetical protein
VSGLVWVLLVGKVPTESVALVICFFNKIHLGTDPTVVQSAIFLVLMYAC